MESNNEMHGMNINSFNVRGMRDKNKRRKIFYSVQNDIEQWKSEWGQNVFMNSGTPHSCGVAI